MADEFGERPSEVHSSSARIDSLVKSSRRFVIVEYAAFFVIGIGSMLFVFGVLDGAYLSLFVVAAVAALIVSKRSRRTADRSQTPQHAPPEEL